MDKKVELLAPAGEPASFYGAINAGADAVYLAGNQFGARAYAENFSQEELISCLRHARLHGKKIYLTVNTLVKEEELSELPKFLRPLVEEGLDGVIVQDFGVLSFLRDTFPGLPLHASTQMSVTGPYGAKYLKALGVSRVVPARELSLKEIIEIKKESGLEIESFIHGAMCYSYSGQCLFSSMLGGRSGNRGRCAQPCRLPYRIPEGKKLSGECYPLSLKDMCTIEILPELIDAGIDSFKIEGRMKRPEYAAGVTSFYRKYIDLYLEGKSGTPQGKDLRDLSSLYLRSERGTGYYHQRNGREMVTLSSPAYKASDEALLQRIHDAYLTEKKKIAVTIKAKLKLGLPAMLEITTAGRPSFSANATGEVVMAAEKAPISLENVEKQLKKLGDSPFCLSDDAGNGIFIEMDENVFYSLKSLNELRRTCVKKLEEVMLGVGDAE